MRILLLLLSFSFLSCSAFAQAKDTPAKPVFQYVEQMPSFNGDINDYLAHNIKYPKKAINQNIQGRVLVKFIVNEDGSITDAKIVRGIGGGCDEEALRVILAMPKWKPGKQNGQFVKTIFTQPITFRIQ